MRIGFFGIEQQEKKDFYTQKLGDHQLDFYQECLNPENPPPHLEYDIIAIFVGCKVNKKIIDAMPNLKMIAIRSTGYDNVDLEYAKQKQIVVSNVPAYGSHTVAEFAFALILAVSRKVDQAANRLKQEKQILNKEGLRGFDLFGKTLGVIGTGKIGANAARIAKGFGMHVLAYDAYPNEEVKNEIGFEYTDLNTLLSNSDILTIHAPSNDATYHMINKDNIYTMKKGAILINTARGKVLDTAALFDALKNNHLSAAGIDVFENENDLSELEKSLIDLPNVVATPHVGFFTKEAEDAIMNTTVDNIHKFIEGNSQNVVNQWW